jgi:8-oxo-dGTP diphosphatase
VKKKQGIRKLDGGTGKPSGPRNGSAPGAGTPHAPKTLRLVVAALILRPAAGGGDEVLICQRKPDQPMSLKWEFPGGKIEPGEGPEEALKRELNEELGIDAEIGAPLVRIRHNYRNGGAVDLQFFIVRSFAGELENRIFQQILWSDFASLPKYDFLAADLGLIRDLADGKLTVSN